MADRLFFHKWILMHIGINALSLIPGVTGGGETYLAGLLHALDKVDKTNRYTLFVTNANKAAFGMLSARFECASVPLGHCPRLRRVLFEHTKLAKLVARRGVDVLYCPGNMAIRVRDCAQVMCMQSMLYSLAPEAVPWLRREYFKRIVPWSVRRADMVIAVSEDTRRSWRTLGRAGNRQVRGVALAPQLPEPQPLPILLSAGAADDAVRLLPPASAN